MSKQELFLLEKDAARMSDQLTEITIDTNALLTKLSESGEASGYATGLSQMQLSCLLARYEAFEKEAEGLKERLAAETDAMSESDARDRARICGASLSQLCLLAAKEKERLLPLAGSLQMAGKAHALSRESEQSALLSKLRQALSDKPAGETQTDSSNR